MATYAHFLSYKTQEAVIDVAKGKMPANFIDGRTLAAMKRQGFVKVKDGMTKSTLKGRKAAKSIVGWRKSDGIVLDAGKRIGYSNNRGQLTRKHIHRFFSQQDVPAALEKYKHKCINE